MGAVRRQSWITDLPTGFGCLRRQRELLAVQVTSVALAMTDSAWFNLAVLYLRDVLGLRGLWFGIMLAIGAVGGLTGGLLAARVVRAVGMRSTITASLLIAVAGQLALGLTSDVVVTAIVLATSSLVFVVWNVATRTLIQRRTPPELLGRISSINSTVIITASILGAVLGGIVAQQLGLHALFLFGVPLLLVATSVGWWALRARR
jgi:predicted MFS family arabinose efflux permease